MAIRARVVRLERQLPPLVPRSPEDARSQRRWRKVARRFQDHLEQALLLMNEEEQQQVQDALDARWEGKSGALNRWLDDLSEGRCRLPVLSPQTMKELMLSWFHPEVGQPMVCNVCGLEYPRLKRPRHAAAPSQQPGVSMPLEMPRLFDECPSCGASRYDTGWPYQSPDIQLPWKQLDGWAGPIRPTASRGGSQNQDVDAGVAQ
jgi:hypothetical protein